MKTRSIVTVGVLILTLLVLTAAKNKQETQTFEGIFDGKEDYGYNFIGVDEEDEEYTMTFQKIDAALLGSFDLKSEQLIGSKFRITYTSEIEIEKDEDGYEDETEINTIVALKKL